MRKNYIIKDVRKTLAQQINNIDTSERTSMENTHFSSTGLSAVIPKDNDGFIRSILEYSLSIMTLKQRAAIGMGTLIKTYWRSIIVEKAGKGAA